MRLRDSNDGYDYICTHVDDFKIIARQPSKWLDAIKEKFLVKAAGDPDYYLGNHFHYIKEEGIWVYDCDKYVEEALAKLEREHGDIRYRKTPLPTGDLHPELDDSDILTLKDHRVYQQLIGMGVWMTLIGRPDICFAICSLSRFSACPRRTHLDLLFHVYGYLKQFPKKKIAIDSRNINLKELPNCEQLQPDFLEEYRDAKEDIGSSHPTPFGPKLGITFLCDSDHGHDKKTRRSITGMLGFVGSTLVFYGSKRQGAVATSTYAAEFMAL